MIEKEIEVQATDGVMSTFVVHPEEELPAPGVVFLMDAAGIRESLRDMCRRLATAGYYVMLPDLFYRHGRHVGVDRERIDAQDPSEREKLRSLVGSLVNAKVVDDLGALLAATASDRAMSNGPVGAVGYCMSGRYALLAAARWPNRVRAAASFFGTRLVTDQPDSPHLGLPAITGEAYFNFAEVDEYAPAPMVDAFTKAVRDAKINCRVETYAGTHHAFAIPEARQFDRVASDRHWERLLALFRRNLRPSS